MSGRTYERILAGLYHYSAVGHLLLKTVEEHARENGFCALATMARATATVYFQKYGFHIVGMPTPHLGTTHLVAMEKELD